MCQQKPVLELTPHPVEFFIFVPGKYFRPEGSLSLGSSKQSSKIVNNPDSPQPKPNPVRVSADQQRGALRGGPHRLCRRRRCRWKWPPPPPTAAAAAPEAASVVRQRRRPLVRDREAQLAPAQHGQQAEQASRGLALILGRFSRNSGVDCDYGYVGFTRTRGQGPGRRAARIISYNFPHTFIQE